MEIVVGYTPTPQHQLPMATREYISPSDARFDSIQEGICKSYANACVIWIEELKNEELEEGYQAQKDAIEKQRGKVEERMMYHGTREAIAHRIIEMGFDPTANTRSAYGKGSYFARDASYSKDYAPPASSDDLSYLLLCSVLIGSCGRYGHNQTIDIATHDNSVDNRANPAIVVTPYRYGAIPRYLIAFYKNAK